MCRVEIALAVLTITCTVWARIHHWRANRNKNSISANPRRDPTQGEMMGFRKPPKPDPKKDKANNNQSSGSACGRCGGSGVINVTATDGSGNTVSMTQDCPSCN